SMETSPHLCQRSAAHHHLEELGVMNTFSSFTGDDDDAITGRRLVISRDRHLGSFLSKNSGEILRTGARGIPADFITD
ncbi:hypothetical protein, partial [Rhodovulum sulfidophilum]|uniref:hypothetical protein n=1 Tax=Rhodovulum sulfidophilum TaxID=35806 RepID=UPI001F2E4C21